jgi:hypothetical protein
LGAYVNAVQTDKPTSRSKLHSAPPGNWLQKARFSSLVGRVFLILLLGLFVNPVSVTHVGAQAENLTRAGTPRTVLCAVNNPRRLSPILSEVDPFLFDVPVLALHP